MTLVRLGDTAQFVNGVAFKPTDWADDGLPIIRIQNLTGTGESFNRTNRQVRPELIVEAGDLLVSWSATLDAYRWAGPRGVLNQHIFKVLPKEGVNADYLYFALRQVIAELERKTHGSTMKHVVRGDFESTRIPLPPLQEQQRIVDLLSRAENIVRMRREAEEKAREIIPALFLDMFGDPGTNLRGDPAASSAGGEGQRGPAQLVRLRDLVARFESGKNLQAGAEGESPFRILKISAVTSGEYDESESKPAPQSFDPPPSYVVRIGDILFSRANTEALVGATAMVGATDEKSLLPDKLWRIVWEAAAPIRPMYMLALFQNPSVRRSLSQLASGTGGSMKNISQTKLLELRLPIWPLNLQLAFERHSTRANEILGGARRGSAVATQAFQSLLAGIFAQ